MCYLLFSEEIVPQYSEQVFFEHFRLSRATSNNVGQQYGASVYFHNQPGQYGTVSSIDQVSKIHEPFSLKI